MRTTSALDNDVFAYACADALRERVSIGDPLSRIARRSI